MTIGANQKTTISAAVSAGAAFVLFASQPPFSIHFPQWISAVAMFAMVGGLAAFGVAAKDSNVTGGSIVQPGIPVADPVAAARVAAAVIVPTPVAEVPPKSAYKPSAANVAKW